MTTSYNGNSKQVLVGAAAFFVSATGADLPDLSGAGSAKDIIAAATTDWSAVGFTENGVEVSYEPTYGDVVVDQLLDSAVIFKSGMKVMVNTSFAEATLENLLIVWGQSDDTLNSSVLSIEGGSLGDSPTERALAFVGPGPRTAGDAERVYHVNRAIQSQTTAHKLARDAATTLPVSFRCLPGGSFSGATQTSYGTVRDRAITA